VPHASLLQEQRTLTVTFELLIGILKQDAESPNYVLNMPVTDSELEASLDVFEYQIYQALQADNPAANCFRTIAYGLEQVISRRGASTEGGTKIAARQITYEAKCLPEMHSPVLPPYMVPFLDALEASDGFPGIGQQLKQIYSGNGAVSDTDRLRGSMGWSNDTFSRLAYPPTPLVMLGTPVTWLDQHGKPL
jgi:hypothetical protein